MKEKKKRRNRNWSEKEEIIVKAVSGKAMRNKVLVLSGWKFDDLCQELRAHLLQTPSKYTSLWKISRNKILQLIEKELADKRITNIKAVSLSKEIRQRDGNVIFLENLIPDPRFSSTVDNLSRKVEVEEALKKLSPMQQGICYCLSEGYFAKEIAEMMGMHRKSIAYQIAKIREIFIKEGLR